MQGMDRYSVPNGETVRFGSVRCRIHLAAQDVQQVIAIDKRIASWGSFSVVRGTEFLELFHRLARRM